MGKINWETSDGKRKIIIDRKCRRKFDVYMINPDNTTTKEENYAGDGNFGGKNFFEEIYKNNPELSKKICEKKNKKIEPKKIKKGEKMAHIIGKSAEKEHLVKVRNEELEAAKQEKQRLEGEYEEKLRKITEKCDNLEEDVILLNKDILVLKYEKESIENCNSKEIDDITENERSLFRSIGIDIFYGESLTKDELKNAKFPKLCETIDSKYENLKNSKVSRYDDDGCGKCKYCRSRDDSDDDYESEKPKESDTDSDDDN